MITITHTITIAFIISAIISNKPIVRQGHPGVPAGSDGSDIISDPLTVNLM